VKKLKTGVDTEQLLQWAYLDELPKRQISSAEGVWDGVREYGQRGGIDIGGGGAQRYPHFGLPHPDAEAIEKAVGALGTASIEDNYDVIVGELAALVTVNDFLPRKDGRVRRRQCGLGVGTGAEATEGVVRVNDSRVREFDLEGNRAGTKEATCCCASTILGMWIEPTAGDPRVSFRPAGTFKGLASLTLPRSGPSRSAMVKAARLKLSVHSLGVCTTDEHRRNRP